MHNETYATIVHAPDIRLSVCQAAVLGSALREFDPRRKRIVLVAGGASQEARRVLQREGLWHVIETRTLVSASERQLTYISGRKLPAFRLPYARVMYLDADILPLRSFTHIWNTRPAPVRATLNVPTEAFTRRFSGRCLNGGVLLIDTEFRAAAVLGASVTVAARLESALRDQLKMNRASLFERCPQGRDQPALNAAFADWRPLPVSVALPAVGLRQMPSQTHNMSLVVHGDKVRDLSRVSLEHVDALFAGLHLYHAWGSTDPLSLAKYGTCTPPRGTTSDAVAPCHIVRDDLSAPVASALHAAFARKWWARFHTLPNVTQRYCTSSNGPQMRPGHYLKGFF